ncbi:MAG: DUF4384 domain-containing protein [Elusimicrobia bacterium]|nr:DUF4384 domain-containing protein [Elusimicrobiota bacterium]
MKINVFLTAAMLTINGCDSGTDKNLRGRSERMFQEKGREAAHRDGDLAEPEKTEEKKTEPLALPSPTRGEGKKKEGEQKGQRIYDFEEEGLWVMSKAETQLEAQKHAEDEALSKALRKAGVDSYYGFSDILAQQGGETTQALASYTGTWSKGVAQVDDRQADCNRREDGLFECRVKIRGRVVFNGEPDPGFEIKADLTRSLLKDGEEVAFKARVSDDSYLHVFSVDEEQNVYLVFPNKFFPDAKTAADKPFEFPAEGSGLALRAALREGTNKATEVLHIIAVKERPLFKLEELGEESVGPYKVLTPGKLGEVMAKLAKMKRSDWTMVVLPYQITK